MQPSKNRPKVESLVVLRRPHTAHRLSLIVVGLYKVISIHALTVTIQTVFIIERTSLDHIAHSPKTASGTPEILTDAFQATAISRLSQKTSSPRPPALQSSTSDGTPKYIAEHIIEHGMVADQLPAYRVQ